MKKVTNLKIQYSLKKIYTYNFFRLLNKSNQVFIQNNFNFLNYFKVLNFFFFKKVFMLDKLQFNKNLILFYKYDKNSRNLLFINKYQQKYKTLSGKNYALALSILNSHDRS